MINLVNLEGFEVKQQFFKTVLPVTTATHELAFKEVLDKINAIVGGSSVTDMRGSWLDVNGHEIQDRNKAIEFYHDLSAENIKSIIAQIAVYQLSTGEDKIMLVFNNEMVLVDSSTIKRLMERIV